MKYVAYYRVSTKKQGKSGLGLEAQKEIVKHFINKKQGSVIVADFVEVESGKDIDNRLELKKAITKAKKENAFLIVAKLDRLSRDVEHIFKIKKQLGDLLESCDLPNTDSLTLSIFAGLAQREREIISIRTKVALNQKKRNYLNSIGLTFDEYQNLSDVEKLEIHTRQDYPFGNIDNFTSKGRTKGRAKYRKKTLENENNKRAMELISLYKSQGLTLQQIADKLNENGFKTPGVKRKGVLVRGKFEKVTVSRLYKRYLELQNDK